MPGQHVHDRSGLRPVQQVDGQVIHQAVGRPGQQEPAVREGGPEARAEPVVGQRKSPGQPVVEGQVLVGPVGHGRGLVALGRGLLGRGHETVQLALSPLRVAGAPALAGHAVLLHGGTRVMRRDHGSRRVGILGIRRTIVPAREPLPPAECAEVVVEGVVLHHQDDDVLDMRQHVRAGRAGGIGPVAAPDGARPPLPLAQLPAFDPLPSARAGHGTLLPIVNRFTHVNCPADGAAWQVVAETGQASRRPLVRHPAARSRPARCVPCRWMSGRTRADGRPRDGKRCCADRVPITAVRNVRAAGWLIPAWRGRGSAPIMPKRGRTELA